MGRVVLILFALLVAPGQGHAQSGPPDANRMESGWIRPEEVPIRADELRRRLEAAEPDTTAQAALDRIEKDLARLGPELDARVRQTSAAVAQSTPFVELDDLRRELATLGAPLSAWEQKLAAEATRVSDVLDGIAQAQRIWSATRDRPETSAAGEVVERRVRGSLEALEKAATSLRSWRARVLAVSDRLVDRRAAVDEALERLRAVMATERTKLVVPGRSPLWQGGFGARVLSELPRVPDEIRSYARATYAYVERDPRPLVAQALLAALLMFVLGRLSARGHLNRSEVPAGATRLIERPYAVALLLAILASPAFHTLAPQRFRQLLAIIALLPAARIVINATEHANLLGFAGLFVLFLVDRVSLALTPLPAVSRASFLLVMAIGLALASWFARRVRRAGDAPMLRRAAQLAMVGLALALVAEVGGWSNLATLLCHGIVGGATVAVYIYAAAIGLRPVLVYVLGSPTLQRSRLFERNTAVLQRRTEHVLRWVAAALWLYYVLRAIGLQTEGVEALSALLRASVSIGTLALSIGAVLAFVVTLLTALLLARIVNALLEEEVYPRTNLPRGVPFALSALARYAVYSLGFLFALAAAGVQLNKIAILLGGLGVGVGLGLQDLVKNVAGGLTLLLERRLRVGDALQIPGQDIFGRVRSIGLRATVVQSWNGSEVVVPNADLVSGAITNWTLSDRLCRIEVPVGVAYGSDPERVVTLLLGVAQSVDQLLADPPPQALFKGFGESSLDFVLRAWTDAGYEQAGSLVSELGLAMHRTLVEAGITIPAPQRDVHVASVSPAVRDALSSLGPKV